MNETIKVTTAYIVISLFSLAAITLLAILIHLLYTAKVKCQNIKKNKSVLLTIIITLIGISSFFFSVLLIILLLIQVILIDGHNLETTSFYYQSFEEIEFLIVVFDQFGHLSMLSVFIVRLKMCFANSIFGYNNNFMRILYCCLIVLIFASFLIIIEIINGADVEIIIICSIIWEILIEIMCIWLLYLFVSKLQCLVKMALGASRKNLRLTISYNISEKSKISKRASVGRISRNASKTSVGSPNTSRNPSPSPSPNASRAASPSPAPSPIATPRASQKKTPNQTVLNNQNLVNVMTKMTLLVVIAVTGSMISVVGNIYIEIHALETLKKHTADIHSMWAFLLPVIDMVLASFMLYLQFDFTKHVYSKMCSKMDILFIQFCGNLLDKEVTNKRQKDKVMTETRDTSIRDISINNSFNFNRTITPKSVNTNNNKKLTLDITDIVSEPDNVFRPPSPSPAALVEVPSPKTPRTPRTPPPPKHNMVINAMKHNESIEITICGKCNHIGCSCKIYQKSHSKWSKGKCKSCNHSQIEHQKS